MVKVRAKDKANAEAAQVVMFAYLGVEMIGLTAGEARNPQKTIPNTRPGFQDLEEHLKAPRAKAAT